MDRKFINELNESALLVLNEEPDAARMVIGHPQPKYQPPQAKRLSFNPYKDKETAHKHALFVAKQYQHPERRDGLKKHTQRHELKMSKLHGGDWFKSMAKEAQAEYLKLHPHSQFKH